MIFGLKNYGQTCYLNSVMQCLLNTPYFYKNIATRESRICLSYEIKKFVKNYVIYGKNNILGVCQYIDADTQLFNVFEQNDAHEFLNYMLEKLHEECKFNNSNPNLVFNSLGVVYCMTSMIKVEKKMKLINNEKIKTLENRLSDHFNNNPNEYTKYMAQETIKKINKIEGQSYLMNDFLGVYKSTVECSECKSKNDTYEHFTTLSIDVKYSTIDKCLHNFTKPELLKGDNKFFCNKCNIHVNGVKYIEFIYLPQNLVIIFKRFRQRIVNNVYVQKKNNKFIDIDLDGINLQTNYQECDYKLFSICSHIGTCEFGHYYVQVKKKNNWYAIDDEMIYNRQNEYDIIKNAYIMFYSRQK